MTQQAGKSHTSQGGEWQVMEGRKGSRIPACALLRAAMLAAFQQPQCAWELINRGSGMPQYGTAAQ